MRIVVIHHARTFDSTKEYLSDDFKNANEKLFGAQEMDTWGGVRLLSVNHVVWRIEICPNIRKARFITPDGQVIKQISVDFPQGLDKLKKFFYIKSLFKYLDTSIAYFADKSLKNEISAFILHHQIDLAWWDTQFYDALIPAGVKSIVRSVNFEPKHVLSEDPSLFRWVRFAGKLWSERRISRNRFLVSISPSDRKNYKRIGAKQIHEIPLRQLPFVLDSQFEVVENRTNLVFFGSSFDVRHNRRNLESLACDIAPLIAKTSPGVQIASFGHRIPRGFTLPENMHHFGFVPNLQGIQIGSLGVIVPFNGGAGMQSKIFEPLCLGVPLIANPRNFADYNFIPGVHYLAATNPTEYVLAVKFLRENHNEIEKMQQKTRSATLALFNRRVYLNHLDILISKVFEDTNSFLSSP